MTTELEEHAEAAVRRGSGPAAPLLSAELVDRIAEVVAVPPTALGRAAAICSVVREIYESVEWVHGYAIDNQELSSLRRVLAETQNHQHRMGPPPSSAQ